MGLIALFRVFELGNIQKSNINSSNELWDEFDKTSVLLLCS